MIIEELTLDTDRPLDSLTEALEQEGGRVVVIRWQRGLPKLAHLYLPVDPARQSKCRAIVEEWVTAGTWPAGHPRRPLVPAYVSNLVKRTRPVPR